MRAIDRVLAKVGEDVRGGHGRYTARCPAHDDRTPSLAITDLPDRVLIKCRANCKQEAVVQALGLTMNDLFDDKTGSLSTPPARPQASRPEKVFPTLEAAIEAAERRKGAASGRYIYRDGNGQEFAAVVRHPLPEQGKTFTQITRRGNGWVHRGPDGKWIVYGLDRLPAMGRVYVVEGEKKVDAAYRIGLAAVCSQGGANGGSRTDWSPLAGREVVILPDNDKPGHEYAAGVSAILRMLDPPATVRIVDIPGLPEKGDIADLVDATSTADELLELKNRVAALADAAPFEAVIATTAAAVGPAADAGCVTDLTRPDTCHERGLALRFAGAIRGRLVYVRERSMWLAFDGKRWAERADHIAVEEAKALSDQLWRELAGLDAAARTAKVVGFVESTSTKKRIDAVLGLARTEPGINVSQAEFDAHPWLLNVENGVLDLRAGELLPHDPDLRLTQLAAVAYDPDARSELWERFMHEVTCGDEDIERFVQQAFGLALTGDVSDEVLICHNGGGCNGKSTALEAVAAMLGDYAAVAPPGLFTARNFDSHPTEVAAMHGKRFVTAIEQEANRALREALVKSLTGGDTIRTRRMREDFWEMKPTWHIHIAYNRAPRLSGTDDGIRRRLRVVPWAASFKDRPDLTVKERLVGPGERAGILAWCLEGLRLRLAAGRLESPQAVMIATDDYIDDEDLVGRFVADCCTTDDPRGEAEIRETLQAFRRWMQADGTPRHVVDGYTANMLGRELARRGFRKHRPDHGVHRKRTVYVGLRLAADCEYAQVGEDWPSPFDR